GPTGPCSSGSIIESAQALSCIHLEKPSGGTMGSSPSGKAKSAKLGSSWLGCGSVIAIATGEFQLHRPPGPTGAALTTATLSACHGKRPPRAPQAVGSGPARSWRREPALGGGAGRHA